MAISGDVHSHTCPWVGSHLFLYCPCNTCFLHFFCCTFLRQPLPIVSNFPCFYPPLPPSSPPPLFGPQWSVAMSSLLLRDPFLLFPHLLQQGRAGHRDNRKPEIWEDFAVFYALYTQHHHKTQAKPSSSIYHHLRPQHKGCRGPRAS